MTLSKRDVKDGNKDWLMGTTVRIRQVMARQFKI